MALVVTACGDDSEPTVRFGDGEIPPAFPSDLPVPGDAVIGTTLIDELNSKSQFEFRTATPIDELVRGLSVSLVSTGYVVDESQGDATSWRIEFRRGNLTGRYDLVPAGPTASQGVVEVDET